MKLFYDKCGGFIFNNNIFYFEIVSSKEMVLVNPIIVGELCEENISSEWYIIGKDKENDYRTLNKIVFLSSVLFIKYLKHLLK